MRLHVLPLALGVGVPALRQGVPTHLLTQGVHWVGELVLGLELGLESALESALELEPALELELE